MKLDGLDHPKTLDLAARLDISLPQAIGHLELLWAFVAQKTPHGNVGKWPDGAIARASHWTGDATTFVTALRDAGLIEDHPEYRYIVHDWHEHAPRWVASKLSRAKQSFCMPADQGQQQKETEEQDSTGDDTSDNSADYTPDDSGESKPSLAKSSEAESSEDTDAGASDGGSSPPDDPFASDSPPKSKGKLSQADLKNHYGLPDDLAAQFMAIRKDKRMTLTPKAMDDLVREFGKAGLSVIDGITLCCRKSWAGFKASWNWQDSGGGQRNGGGAPAGETPQQRGERMARERGYV